MFNFLDSKLTPKIVCKSAAMDNYEIENLISTSHIEKSRGFIAYSAIKPPVEIEINLICSVNIHYIVLNTTVGSQRCSGIEILAKTSLLDYTPICKSVYDKEGIIFCNSRKYSNNERPVSNKDYHLAFFRSNTFKYFLNAIGLKIIIFRTEKSVPCLGSIEVWGVPSKSCSAVTAQTINYLMTKSGVKNSKPCASESKADNFLIPEDFKDGLTYEIMSVPMTLPSGKTVDQSTLEKHVNSEVSFGRKPGDPFTGIKFTDKIKPVLNVALKSRIDMFLLHNSHRKELHNVKRTVGRMSSTSSTNINNIRKRKYNCDDDLDKLIAKAKENPNFHEFSSEDAEDYKTCKCAGCGDESLQALYGILCQHRYCRTCMLGVSVELKCSVCDMTFEKSDVRKCYL